MNLKANPTGPPNMMMKSDPSTNFDNTGNMMMKNDPIGNFDGSNQMMMKNDPGMQSNLAPNHPMNQLNNPLNNVMKQVFH